MPGHIRDLRKRTSQPYSGRKPWQARWQHPRDARKRVERSFATKREATDWMSQSDTDATRGVWADPHKGNVSLGDVAEEWFAASLKRWQEGYAALQRNSLDAWLNPSGDPARKTDPIGRKYALTSRKIVSITTEEVEHWRDAIYGPRALKTTRKQFAMLNSIFKFAKQRGYVAINPCADVSSLVAAPAEHRLYEPGKGSPASTPGRADPFAVLAPDEIALLAGAFVHRPYAVAVEFDAWMGLRASELWALTRKDFNLLAGTVTVERGFKEINGYLKVGPLKTASAYRTIAMPESIQTLMEVYLDEYVDASPDALVFRTVTGAPVRHNSFYGIVFVPTARATFPERTARAVAAVVAAAEANAPGRVKRTEHVPPFRFHDLRHTAASLMIHSIDNASALIVVKERLGHKDISTTVNIYNHLLPHADADIAKALDRLRVAHRPTLQPLRAVGAAT
jgi:integrase